MTAAYLHVVLDRPAIAGNVGACVRLAAATGVALHVCGTTLDARDRELWRAGLDYWPIARVHFHRSLDRCLALLERTPWIIEVGGEKAPWDVQFAHGDVVVIGPEKGSVTIASEPGRIVTLPMIAGRSLNLSQCAAVIAFEAMRQSSVSSSVRPGELRPGVSRSISR
jgi:tRNA (cytidine/uridine-2'-O-)-methyltransferase